MLLRCIALNWDTGKIAEKMGVSKSTIGSMKYTLRMRLPDSYTGPHGLYKWAQEHAEELK